MRDGGRFNVEGFFDAGDSLVEVLVVGAGAIEVMIKGEDGGVGFLLELLELLDKVAEGDLDVDESEDKELCDHSDHLIGV